jgi:hypothetical protein
MHGAILKGAEQGCEHNYKYIMPLGEIISAVDSDVFWYILND